MEMQIILIAIEFFVLMIISALGFTFKTAFSEIKSDIKEIKDDLNTKIAVLENDMADISRKVNIIDKDVEIIKFVHKKQRGEEI